MDLLTAGCMILLYF